MKKSTTDTCCLTLPLILEKWQKDRLEKRFEIARQLYNTLLNYEIKKLHRLENTSAYRSVQSRISAILKEGKDNSAPLKALYDERKQLRKDFGFTEYAFKSDMNQFYKYFNANIGSSVAVHGIASQVWTAFDSLFFKKGKKLHFKSKGELNSVRGYSVSGKSGGVEIMFRGTYVEWKGLKLPVKLDESNAYENEMLNKRVKYCRIIRKPGKTQSRWYVQLSLEGKPTVKYDPKTGEILHPIGSGVVGIDIGPQTIAYCSNTEIDLLELADKVQNIEHQKKLLQRKLDRSRRATNPGNYAEDGTIRRGVKLTKNKSKRYKRLQHQLSTLQHQQAEIRKRQHNSLANHLLTLGDRFYVEDMEWPALARRSKLTEISEKTGRYKRKKRFGKSIANKAPASLIDMLNMKLKSRGYPEVCEVNTRVRASQYNHLTDDYQKKSLNQRWNDMPDGRRIQRDLYSAFLLQHMNASQDGFDKNALYSDYESFVVLHDQVIEHIRSLPRSPSSMGV